MARKKNLTPAQKAWKTMRERYTDEEITERASAAAHKAWETRRANERKSKRKKKR